MNWKRCHLTNEQILAGEWKRLQDAFETMFMAAMAPKKSALFSRSFVDRNGEEFFLSPEAAPWADSPPLSRYAWLDVERPNGTLGLLVGHDRILEEL